MTQRDAVDVEADALMDLIHSDDGEVDDYPATIPQVDWRDFPSDVAHRDAIAEALRSASNSAAEAMPGIYIASKAKHGPHWQTYRANGVPIISTWIDESGEGDTSDYHDLWHRCATEAARAAVTVLYHEEGETLKGALLEAGAALSHDRHIIIVGDPPGTWVRHRNVTRASTIEEAFREAAEVIRALPAPAPASPWRDMETAPKTGERILLKVRPRSHLGDETEQVAVGRWLDNTGTKMPWQGWITDLAVCSQAFGWMPLPSTDLPTPPASKDTT